MKQALFVALAILCPALMQVHENDVSVIDWVEGTWVRQGKRGPVYEVWAKVADGSLRGAAFRVAGEDTTFVERLELISRNDSIFYVADVAQNPAPVEFHLVHHTATVFTFENFKHDFPQRIVYTKLSADSMDVYIEKANAGDGRINYRFRRTGGP